MEARCIMKKRGWSVALLALAVSGVAVLLITSRDTSPTMPSQSPESDWFSTLAEEAVDEFDRLDGPWTLNLPDDHGVHPEGRIETWQLSAHLTDGDGQPVGLQFLLSRIGLAGPDAPPPVSDWEVRDLYRGHVIILTSEGAAIYARERFGRGMAGLAGYDDEERELRLDSWALVFQDDADGAHWRLTTGPGDLSMDLVLTIDKDVMEVAGDTVPFRGYTFSRMRAEGTVTTEDGPQPVSGLASFEHLWGDLPIPGGSPVTTDRLQLQLDDGSDVSIVRSRRRDGSGTPTLEALLVDADGSVSQFGDDEAQAHTARLWQGTEAWPIEWRLKLDDLQLEITPIIDAQEHRFILPLWAGLVRAQGQRGDQPISGLGTLQLTAGQR